MLRYSRGLLALAVLLVSCGSHPYEIEYLNFVCQVAQECHKAYGLTLILEGGTVDREGRKTIIDLGFSGVGEVNKDEARSTLLGCWEILEGALNERESSREFLAEVPFRGASLSIDWLDEDGYYALYPYVTGISSDGDEIVYWYHNERDQIEIYKEERESIDEARALINEDAA